VVVLLAAAGAAVLWARWEPPRISEREVRETVYTTIQREAEASFYVTGFIEVVAATTVEDTRVLLPRMLDLRMGTTRATVRVPGRVSYGFDAGALRPEMIRVDGDVVEVQIPPLSIYSAEADLANLEVETSVGWTRAQATGQQAEHRALRHINDALRQQGDAHLETSVQPRVNTARALETLLAPVLRAAGLPDPQLRFRIGGDLVVEPGR